MPPTGVSAPLEKSAALTYRPASSDDARLFAEMTLAWRPDEPDDPHAVKHRWSHPTPGFLEERFIIEAGGAPIGYGETSKHAAGEDPEENGSLWMFLLPSEFTPAR